MLNNSAQTWNTQQCQFVFPSKTIKGKGISQGHNICQVVIVLFQETFRHMETCQPQAGIGVADLLLKCHQLEKELAASANLSVDEFHCLSQLYMHAPCCAKELCEFLNIHPSRASKLLNDLERRGYVARALGFPDKRREHLTLTPEGIVVARSLLQSSTLKVGQLASVLSSEAITLLASSAGTPESGPLST